jgi:hypothetical protein
VVVLPSVERFSGFFWEQPTPESEYRSWWQTRGEIELRPGARLSYYTLDGLVDEAIPLLTDVGPFDTLSIDGCSELTESGLELLVSRTTVRHLYLYGFPFTPRSLEILAGWGELESLGFGFRDCALTDADFEPIAGMKNLRSLSVSAGGRRPILDRDPSEVPKGGRPVGGMSTGGRCALDGSFLQFLPPTMRHLYIFQPSGSSESFAMPGGVTVRPVESFHWHLPDDWFRLLAKDSGLETVVISRAVIGAELDLSPLARCSKLTGLSFFQCVLSENKSSLGAQLRSLPALRSLDLAGVAFNSPDDVELIRGLCLHALDLFHVSQVRYLIDSLPRVLPSLVALNLGHSDCSDDDLIRLTQLPELRVLNLDFAWACTDAGVARFRSIRPDVIVLRTN